MNKILIITAPSGSGKTTIVKQVLKVFPQITFSISACTRNPRAEEKDGVDYYFLSVQDFEDRITKNAFVEWEMVYAGKYYGTLKSELNRIWEQEKVPLFDIDVHGALHVKKKYTDSALSIFIKAPSMEELRNRLEKRGTETPESMEERLCKAEEEIRLAFQFDHIVINDVLETAVAETISHIQHFLGK